MKKPDPVNKVKHQDEFSSGLMESYGQWMDGNTFQGTHMPDIHEAPFDGMDPQSNGAEIEDTTKKKKSAKKESPKAQLATKEETEVLEREEYEIDGETWVLEKVKMDGVDDNGNTSCWKGYKKKGTKIKGGKEVNNCVKAGDEVTHEGEVVAEHHKKDADGNTIPHEGEDLKEYFEKKDGKYVKKHNCAKKVKTKKEGLEYFCIPEQHTLLEDGTVTHYDLVSESGNVVRNVSVEDLEILEAYPHEHAVNFDKNAELLGEKKLDPVGKEDKDIDNDGDHDKSDKYLIARRKKVSKIIGMSKKK